MSTYGIQPTGYVRKPISVILAELEAAMVTEFGPGVIQTPQSPLGQLNGLMADLLAEVDERNLDLYQSYDPDQAEGTRLDTLARLRLIERGSKSDADFRQSITNKGESNPQLSDFIEALKSLDGVTFANVYVNDQGEFDEFEFGSLSVVVMGGSDSEIAETVDRYQVPGISGFGNYRVTYDNDGYCRSFDIVRPEVVDVSLIITVNRKVGSSNCPPPSLQAVSETILNEWSFYNKNGLDFTHYTIRKIIESYYDNVELVSFTGSRDGVALGLSQNVSIGFTEISSLVSVEVRDRAEGFSE